MMTQPPPLPLAEDGGSSGSEGVPAEGGSPYTQAQARAVAQMRAIREYVTQLEAPGAESPVVRVETTNRLRQAELELRQHMHDARRNATLERRQAEFRELETQHRATVEIASRHRQGAGGGGVGAGGATLFSMDDDDEPAGGGDGGADGEAAPRYDIHQDQEFVDFYQRTRENDALMDQALDRIHDGVRRIRDNAQGISHELDRQDVLLDDVHKDVEENHQALSGMNNKMRRAIQKLGKSRLITYCSCCCVLTILIVVIIILAKLL